MLMIFLYFSFKGGEVVQETITSNIGDDIIILEFQRTDGTLITQLIDFRSVSTKNLIINYHCLFLIILCYNSQLFILKFFRNHFF